MLAPRHRSTAQATRKGWPYYRRAARAPPQAVVYSRATPCGWPAVPGRIRGIRQASRGSQHMACHEKVTGTCHSERSEESEVGHAARLVRPDASLPLSMTCQGRFFTACREQVAPTCHSSLRSELHVGGP